MRTLALNGELPRGARRPLKTTEHNEQVAVFDWARANEYRLPALRLLHAIPNGGHRSKATAGRLKAEGVKAGVPDIFLPYPMFEPILRHGLWIEMKVKPNRPTVEQSAWLCALAELGYSTRVCYSADEAIDAIRSYLRMPGSVSREARGTHA